MWKTATSFAANNPNHLAIAAGVHALSWALQIGAHHVFEGRSPALFDNLAQAFLMAPLFVFLEMLFYFGYRPALYKRYSDNVGVAVTKYRRDRAAAGRAAAAEAKKSN
jgi:uncharacterized membrane protein YGL010W